jgi:hypothetical protein
LENQAAGQALADVAVMALGARQVELAHALQVALLAALHQRLLARVSGRRQRQAARLLRDIALQAPRFGLLLVLPAQVDVLAQVDRALPGRV